MVNGNLADGPWIICTLGAFYRSQQKRVPKFFPGSAEACKGRPALLKAQLVAGTKVGETGIERFILIPKGKKGLEERGLDLCGVPSVPLQHFLVSCWGAYDGRSEES
jgi:hypothetical protein